jgi:hypothetical protein
MSQALACLGCQISPSYGLLLLGVRFETDETFISLIFNFFPCHDKLWVTETVHTESADVM